MRHTGHCHCGAIQVEFDSDVALAPRQCQCGFCRRHNARMVSDPAGRVVISLAAEPRRYRFGTRTTDYLICGTCGVYVAAASKIGGRTYATVNLNLFEDPRLDLVAEPVSYEGETAEAKAERRLLKWTPARIG